MKFTKLDLAPYVILLAAGVGYLVISHKAEIVDTLGKLGETRKTAIESTEDIVIDETPTQEIVVEIIDQEPEIIEEIVEEPKEEISDDLFTSGYEFKEDINFEEYKEINQDICGYVVIDDTHISAPIMLNNYQQADNGEDYYLHHDMNGKECTKGEVYIDNRNTSLEEPMYNLSDVSFVYGHHLSGGKVFADICNFKTQEYADNHPFAVIYTPEGYAYKAEVFAGILVSGEDTSIYHDDFETEEEFNEYIEKVYENSYFYEDVNLEYGDKILGFVTCSYENGINGNLRYIVYTKLTKEYTNQLQIDEDLENSVRENVR